MVDENQQPRQLLTIREFSALYGIDTGSIRRRIRLGHLKAFQKPGSPPNSPKYVLDPGWREYKVLLPEMLREPSGRKNGGAIRKNIDPEDNYVFRGVEVAAFLGITPRSVRRLAKQGKLGFAKVGLESSRNRKYSLDSIRKGLAVVGKKNLKKQPSAKKVREALMKWGAKRLGIEVPPIPHS